MNKKVLKWGAVALVAILGALGAAGVLSPKFQDVACELIKPHVAAVADICDARADEVPAE